MKHYLQHRATQDRYFTLANFGLIGASSTYVIYRMAQTLEASEGDVLVVFTAHNEFISNTEMVREEYAQLMAIREQFFRFALMRRAQRYINRYYLARRPEFVEGREQQAFDRSSQRFRDRIALYRQNIETIVNMAQAAGMPLLLLTGPSNGLDWPPARPHGGFVARDVDYAAALVQLRKTLALGAAAEVQSLAQQLLTQRPEDPLAMYYLGKGYHGLGQFDEAERWLQRAKELDPFPLRALDAMNNIVRDQANKQGVFVVDLDRIIKQHAEHGLAGFDLFADNCHPSPEGNFLIAQALMAQLRDLGLVQPENELDHQDLNKLLQSVGFIDGDPSLKTDYFLENARYAMKPPFFNFDGAKWNLENALQLDANRWEIWANLATLSFFADDAIHGKEQLAKAYRLRGEPFDLNDRAAHPLLREALAKAGLEAR
jgi:tetratricopeptide (TPR) repeat protein